MLAVYHKPIPACNFAQTACQAALRLSRDEGVAANRIAAITVRVPRAGALYSALRGGEVEVTEVRGATHRLRLDNVVNATAQEVRDRFRSAAAGVVGGERAGEIE